MDAPVFTYSEEVRGNKEAFVKKNKEDIMATISFLYKRGMWSKFHHDQWMAEVKDMQDEEMLHLWWDSIVGGAMFETEPNFEFNREGTEEAIEEKMEERIDKKMKKKKMHMKIKKIMSSQNMNKKSGLAETIAEQLMG